MTRGKHNAKSAERIANSKPGVSSSDLSPDEVELNKISVP
jgi:hypothetical protein